MLPYPIFLLTYTPLKMRQKETAQYYETLLGAEVAAPSSPLGQQLLLASGYFFVHLGEALQRRARKTQVLEV